MLQHHFSFCYQSLYCNIVENKTDTMLFITVDINKMFDPFD